MILYSRWITLSMPTRHQIAQSFGIPKKGTTHVDSNIIRQDGYLLEDIEKAITVQSMKDFLKTDVNDIEVLWQMVIDRIEGREVEHAHVTPVVVATPKIVVLPKAEATQFKKEFKARSKTGTGKKKTAVKKNATK